MTSSTYCSNPCYRSRIYLNFNMKTSQYILILSLFVLLAGVLSTKVRVVPFDLCHEKPLNLSAYPSENICSDIDLVAPTSSENYERCRVVSGYVSLRHLNLRQNVSFPNLEVITDFLLLYNIYSKNGSQSLNTLFPRLRAINGRRRLINATLYISHFYADDKIEMNSLTDVCGPVRLSEAPTVCFRHSPFYWQIQPKVNLTESFDQFPNITLKNLLIYSLHEDHFDARLRMFYSLQDSLREIWKEFRYVRLSIYHMDNDQYNYMLGRLPKPSNCTDSLGRDKISFLDELADSDRVNTFVRDHVKESIDSNLSLARVPHISQGITFSSSKTELKPQFKFLQANYDILHLFHLRIDARDFSHGMVEMNHTYMFKFDNIYLVKVSTCFGIYIENCTISSIHRFMPTRALFAGAPFADAKTDMSELLKSPNLITAALIASVLFTVALLLVILTRFKSILKKIHRSRILSYRPVNVVSANPDYAGFSNIWSWDPAYQGTLFDDISCEISRSKVIILQQRLLGKGEFGFVHEGILFEENMSNNCDCNGSHHHVRGNGHNSLRVAIKQLRDNAKQIDKEKFMVEAKYMKTFNSNFLVKLIGVVTVQEPILVVMEYMENGDLKRYLRQKYQEIKEKNSFELMLNMDYIVRMAIQIADGMHYLHSKKVIHRDLAARNCMVSQDLTVKIGDFGLTRHVYEKDYYRLSEETPMPLRWMAPESVRKMIFTAQTDVWSYGVVLWEIMMSGRQPYKGTPDQDVKQLLLDCVRLPEPQYPNPVIWELTKRCWNKKPHKRPSFGEIIQQLYPHLNAQKAEFESMSYYYQSCRAKYRNSLSCSLTRLISRHCSNLYVRSPFMSKFTAGQSLSSLNNSQLDRCSDQSLHGFTNGCHCPLSSAGKRHDPCMENQNRRYRRPSGGHRPRCQSFDSGSACSEMTAITSISSVSSQEPSTDSVQNSTGSEQMPLI